jgi:hypothetical protein
MMFLKPDVRELVLREDTRNLLRATKYRRARIRCEAAAALGTLRVESAVPALIELLADSESEVREAAARALGDVGHADAVKPLIGAIGALKGARNDRPESKEYEFEAIAEALGKLNDPAGVAAVIDSGTVRFYDGFFSVSRPHVGGLCLSGGPEARRALIRIVEEHYHYESYSLIGVVEALDYLREPRAIGPLIEIVTSFVETLRKPWQQFTDPDTSCIKNAKALGVAAARALGRLEVRRAEPALIEMLLLLPTLRTDGVGVPAEAGPAFTETQAAILSIRGQQPPAGFDLARASLRLQDYRARRHKTDVEFGGAKRWAETCASAVNL